MGDVRQVRAAGRWDNELVGRGQRLNVAAGVAVVLGTVLMLFYAGMGGLDGERADRAWLGGPVSADSYP